MSDLSGGQALPVHYVSLLQDRVDHSSHHQPGTAPHTTQTRTSATNNGVAHHDLTVIRTDSSDFAATLSTMAANKGAKRKRSFASYNHDDAPQSKRKHTLSQSLEKQPTDVKGAIVKRQDRSLAAKKGTKAASRRSIDSAVFVSSKRKLGHANSRRSLDSSRSSSFGVLRTSPKVNSTGRSQTATRANSLTQKPLHGGKKAEKQKSRGRRQSLTASVRASPSAVENVCENKSRTCAKRSAGVTKHSGNSMPNSPRLPLNQSGIKERLPVKPTVRDNSPGKKPITYRLNGSHKLNNLPKLLSLNSLSGIPSQKVTGTTFSSLRKAFSGANISGTPPLLPKNRYSSAPRPSSLVLSDSEKSPGLFQSCSAFTDKKPTFSENSSSLVSSAEHDKIDASNQAKTSSRRSLAETVEILKRSPFMTTSGGTKLQQPLKSMSGLLSDKPLTPSPSPSPLSPDLGVSFSPVSSSKKSASGTPQSGSDVASWKSSSSTKLKRHLFETHQEVLARWQDGLFYAGKILKIEEKHQKCLLRYEDHSEHWSLFKDIHRGVMKDEMQCCICLGETSDSPNEIVLCDYCGQGYHQKCHSPCIDDLETLDPDDEWCCRQCVFVFAAKRGGALKEGTNALLLRKMKQTFPYDLHRLTWDAQHRTNVEQCYCYCGGPGIWYQKMLQCGRCKQWFHEACLQCADHPIPFGDSFYVFVCTSCNHSNEYLKRLEVDWPMLTHIVLFNLSMERNRKYFDLDGDIMKWLDEHWQALQVKEWDVMSSGERRKQVEDTLLKNKSRFASGSEVRKSRNLWGLRVKTPPPNTNITLPEEGEITDEVMNQLKVKGRRSKTFVPCQSPQSPRLGQAVIDSSSPRSHSSSKHGSPFVKGDGAVISSPGRRSRVKVPLLDKLIPVPENFEGSNNPFLLDVEQEEMKSEREQCRRIWQYCQTATDDAVSLCSFETGSTVSSEGPPVLVKEEGPVIPPVHLSPPNLEEAGAKKRRSRRSCTPATAQATGRTSRRSSVQTLTSTPAPVETSQTKADVRLVKVKSGLGNAFSVYEQLCYTRSVQVLGKRLTSDSALQYLIKWD